MSLKDLDKEDDYGEVIPKKRRGKGKVGRAFGKSKVLLIILIIGVVVGLVLGHYCIEPILNEIEGTANTTCLASKELLTKENDCLYQSIENPKQIIEQCKTS